MSILKGLGLICLFLSICFFGFFAANNLKARAKVLQDICDGILRYKSLVATEGKEISYLLPKSFNELNFLHFSKNKPVISEQNLLKREEKIDLLEFLNGAGKSEKQGEIQRSEAFFETFSAYKKQAQKEKSEKQKIYIVSGICSAAAAVVIFI